jgi:hypothetical protein
MKLLTRFACVLLGVLLLPTAARPQTDLGQEPLTPTGKVSTEYDRFEGKTKVALDDMRLNTPAGSSLILFLRGEFFGKEPQPPRLVGLSIISLSLTGYDRPTTCTLNVIADGEHFKYSLSRYKEAMYVVIFYGQAFRVDLAYSEFRRIAISHTVEMRFCGTEFKMTPEQLGQLNEFRKRFSDEDNNAPRN